MRPQDAVEDSISMVPIAPPVAFSNRLPKPTAGARHAKNKNTVAASAWEFSPSVMSDL